MSDKIGVRIAPNADGEVMGNEEFLAAAEAAGWSEDPGTGKAILVPDERGAPGYEILNPLPFAPPIGYEPTPPIDELIRTRVREAMDQLKDDEEIDDIIDAEDFDIPDELPQLETIYEVLGMEDQAPALKAQEVSEEDRAKADAEYAELVEKHRKLTKHRARAAFLKRQEEDRALYGDDPPPRDQADGEGA